MPEDFDEARMHLLLRMCSELERAVKDRLDASRLFLPPLSYRSRVKSDESIRKKIGSKSVDRSDYGLNNLTDLLGVRFVTLLRIGIADVTDALLSLLTKAGTDALGDFGAAKLREFTQHICPPPMDIDEAGEWVDPLRDKLKAQLNAHYNGNPPIKYQDKIHAQYSGVHLIIDFPVKLYGHSVVIPAEFQIRSVFEEAWAEIDHKLFYKSDGKNEIERRLALGRHLGILKNLLDTAANYAELISDTDPISDPRQPPILPNIDPLGYAEDIAKPIKERRDAIDEFLSLIGDKRKLDEARTKSDEDLRPAYVSLAGRFKELFDKQISKIDPNEFPADQRDRLRSLAYLSLMEQAVSWFLGADEKWVRIAIALYEEITSDQIYDGLQGSRYPTAWFRMGEAKAFLLELTRDDAERDRLSKEAFYAYSRARQTLSAAPEEHNLIVAHEQRSYLDKNIERLQGFVLWRLSDLRRHAPDAKPAAIDLQNLRDAWNVVAERARGLKPPFSKDDLNLFNTATYFATDGLMLCEELGAPADTFPERGELEHMIDVLEDQLRDIQTHEKDFVREEKYAHTLMYGAMYLDDEKRVLTAAKEVLDVHMTVKTPQGGPYDKDMYVRVASEAWEIYGRLNPPDSGKDG